MESLLHGAQRVTSLDGGLGSDERVLLADTERDPRPQAFWIPAYDEGWKDRLIAARRDPEEIDDRNLMLHGFAEPAIVGGIGILSHERVVDGLVSREDLAVHFTLIVVPDASAGLRKDCLDRE